jgi:hypothetical protein
MIISKDTNPGKDLYYLGAIILDSLQAIDSDTVEYITLLQELRNKINISNNLFALSLDWLYLMGVIDLSDEGNINKCF